MVQNRPNNNVSNSNITSPKTGDDTPAELYLDMLAIASAMLFAVLGKKKKVNSK